MNECLRGTKLEEIEISKDCLEYGVGPEAETPPEEEDVGSEGDSMGSEEQRKQSPSSWMKFTYKSPKGKSPVRNPDWKDMSILDLEEDPFRQVQEELDRVESQYSKMEVVIKGTSKLLGDYKVGNIMKELKKLKQ